MIRRESSQRPAAGRACSEQGEKKRKIWIIVIAVILICAALAVIGLMCYGKYQISKIPELSFAEVLEYTTKDNKDACITVGIVKCGQVSWKVCGENGKELPAELHTCEIGSLTKTFTAALVGKAAAEGKLDIDDQIDNYLPLPDGREYPTIRELLTHTSGYKGYYFESPMISSFFKGRNDFYGITKEMVLHKAGKLNMDKDNYGFTYSNFGFAVLGLVLEAVYDSDYATLVNHFTQDELGLGNTQISDQNGDLGKYWDRKADDAYLAAGAITSDITEMLSYAQMQLLEHPYFAECHRSLAVINASTEAYETMGIHMDEIGMAWIVDDKSGIIWHNGGTGNYNSYLGFRPETGTAVVVLSNLAPGYRIPATVMGVKLLEELGNNSNLEVGKW